MELFNFRMTETDNGLELACDALSKTAREGAFTIWYRFPPDCQEVGLVAEPFLTALLVPCMRQKENLKVHAAVSTKLLNSIGIIMDILTAWNSTLSRISIEVDETYEPTDIGDQVGCFFSGGVDSFYSVLKNMERNPNGRDSITHLIILRGYDIGLDDEADLLWTQALSSARKVANELGKQIVPIISNVRVHTDQYKSWGQYPPGELWGSALFGNILASFGLCLSPSFRRIIMASSYSYHDLRPWGSHPLLDPLWSTEATEFVHDGCESTRLQKLVRQVAKSPIAMQTLRVCWENRDGNYNCGECEKCVRTMMALEIAGVLDQCSTFPKPLSLEEFQRMIISDHLRPLYEELIPGAIHAGRTDLAQAIRRCLKNRKTIPPKTIPRKIEREFERFRGKIASLGGKPRR